jgi:hypothetical protein
MSDTTKTSEELNHSRPFDVHTWSDHPETNEFVDRIYKKHFSDPLSNIQRKHLKPILLDLYVKWREDPTLLTGIHRGRSHYLAGSRYNELHISYRVIAVIDRLVGLELIGLEKGYPGDNWSGKGGRASRIWPREKLIRHFLEAKLNPLDVSYHKDKESIILHDAAKDEVKYEDTPQTDSMREVLDAYNFMLLWTHVDCRHLDDPPQIPINQDRKFVRRIFNNSDWEKGGRFYGGFWQRINKEHRSKIMIGGKRTIEIDFSGHHIALLYAQENINYYEEFGFRSDPYDISIPEFIHHPKFSRKLAKDTLLIAVNARDERSAFPAIRKKVKDDADKPHHPAKPKGLSLTNDFLRRVLNLLREKHPLISDMFCSGAGIDLQYTDSRITEHIIKHFAMDRVATGGIPVPVLSVHDSYIIAEEYKDELWEEMQIAWDKETSLKLDPNKVGYLQSLSPQNTRAIQHGYTDELIEDDPEEHQRLIASKEDDYVSPYYIERFKTFEKWRKKGKASM